MGIVRTEVITDFTELDNLDALADAYPELVADSLQASVQKNERAYISELNFQPGAANKPVEWTTETQRKAFFASDGFGGGIPHQRKEPTDWDWDVRVVITPNDARLVTSTKNKAAKYVVGRLRKRGKDTQQKQHKLTGWVPVSETVAFWAVAIRDDALSSLRKRLRGQ